MKCPEGLEADYMARCQELTEPKDLQEIICFQYQRMLRYGGRWHLERRTLLPGYIFLFGNEKVELSRKDRKDSEMRELHGDKEEKEILLSPCESPYLKTFCSETDPGLIGISRGIIKNGVPVVTEGPLKGREQLIKKIDRHKRTAKLGVPLGGKTVEITVGLEIYQKEI